MDKDAKQMRAWANETLDNVERLCRLNQYISATEEAAWCLYHIAHKKPSECGEVKQDG